MGFARTSVTSGKDARPILRLGLQAEVVPGNAGIVLITEKQRSAGSLSAQLLSAMKKVISPSTERPWLTWSGHAKSLEVTGSSWPILHQRCHEKVHVVKQKRYPKNLVKDPAHLELRHENQLCYARYTFGSGGMGACAGLAIGLCQYVMFIQNPIERTRQSYEQYCLGGAQNQMAWPPGSTSCPYSLEQWALLTRGQLLSAFAVDHAPSRTALGVCDESTGSYKLESDTWVNPFDFRTEYSEQHLNAALSSLSQKNVLAITDDQIIQRNADGSATPVAEPAPRVKACFASLNKHIPEFAFDTISSHLSTRYKDAVPAVKNPSQDATLGEILEYEMRVYQAVQESGTATTC